MGLFDLWGVPETKNLPLPQPEPEEEPKAPEPNISEPVVSLAKSFLALEEWKRAITYCGDIGHSYKHTEHDLELEFNYRSRHFAGAESYWYCSCDWMTEDEKKFMGSKLEDRLKLEREFNNAAEREKFMVLVPKEARAFI